MSKSAPKPPACAQKKPGVQITLGPWTVNKDVDAARAAPIKQAMSEAARQTVQNSCGFAPADPPTGSKQAKGFSISGWVVKASGDARNFEVKIRFQLTIDGQLSNISTLESSFQGSGRGLEDETVRASTEARVKMILEAVQSGRAKPLH